MLNRAASHLHIFERLQHLLRGSVSDTMAGGGGAQTRLLLPRWRGHDGAERRLRGKQSVNKVIKRLKRDGGAMQQTTGQEARR